MVYKEGTLMKRKTTNLVIKLLENYEVGDGFHLKGVVEDVGKSGFIYTKGYISSTWNASNFFPILIKDDSNKNFKLHNK